MFDKTVSLGSRLHYPITITKLLKSPGDTIKKQEHIIEYKFPWRRETTNSVTGEDSWTDETTYTEFDSPAEGKLKQWRVKEGQVITADMACMVVEEACGHEVQIQGLCSLCGQDMTETNWASEGRETDRAFINMTHDQTGLMVSENVAMRAEHDAQKRLLTQRKLSLVVDLDQTIIHACIEPTIGEWQRDLNNPNHDAVKDVRNFQLEDGPRGLASGCTYYIKLRPGLQEFLEDVSDKYELHVYTMGTRAYALNIAKIVDPDKKLFGNRVISRDENGSITAKSLQRLFPVSTNMVVIIDDRADVWPMNRPNLIKVVPYDFFKGIGDINSSFLPKRTDIVPAKTNGAPKLAPKPAEKPSPLDEIARMTGDDEKSLQVQAEEQEKTLEKQISERPLLHMQEELDKEEDTQESDETPGGHQRQNLLVDDDEELIALQDHLDDLHTQFYDVYDERRKSRKDAKPQHAPGQSHVRRKSIDDGVDLSMVPDVGDILDELKSNVLDGKVIVLSGLVPLGVKVEESDIGIQAQAFGARVFDNVVKGVTHLVVSSARPRTKKVQQAAKIPSIKIVNQNWLTDSLSQWRQLDERPYFMNISEADRAPVEDSTEPTTDVEEEEVKTLDVNWADAEKELQEFLGSSDSEGESGTETDNESVNSKKRKADEVEDGDSDSNESVLAKKQRVARSRGASALRSEVNGDDEEDGSSLPTPGLTTGDEGAGEQTQEEFDDDLERDLLAELEAGDD